MKWIRLSNGKIVSEEEFNAAVRKWMNNPTLGTITDVLDDPPGSDPDDLRTIAVTLAEDPALRQRVREKFRRGEGGFGGALGTFFILLQLYADHRTRRWTREESS